MTGSVNLALLSQQERTELQADLLACQIRHKLGSLKGRQRQQEGQALLAKVAPGMRDAVVECLRRRSAS